MFVIRFVHYHTQFNGKISIEPIPINYTLQLVGHLASSVTFSSIVTLRNAKVTGVSLFTSQFRGNFLSTNVKTFHHGRTNINDFNYIPSSHRNTVVYFVQNCAQFEAHTKSILVHVLLCHTSEHRRFI